MPLWFVSYKHAAFNFTICLLMDWICMDYLWIIVMFLSAVWTHFDGTHSLHMIHWWASAVMRHFSKYALEWLEGEWISSKFSFWVNCSFKTDFTNAQTKIWSILVTFWSMFLLALEFLLLLLVKCQLWWKHSWKSWNDSWIMKCFSDC